MKTSFVGIFMMFPFRGKYPVTRRAIGEGWIARIGDLMSPLSIEPAYAPATPRGQWRAAHPSSHDFRSVFAEQADRNSVYSTDDQSLSPSEEGAGLDSESGSGGEGSSRVSGGDNTDEVPDPASEKLSENGGSEFEQVPLTGEIDGLSGRVGGDQRGPIDGSELLSLARATQVGLPLLGSNARSSAGAGLLADGKAASSFAQGPVAGDSGTLRASAQTPSPQEAARGAETSAVKVGLTPSGETGTANVQGLGHKDHTKIQGAFHAVRQSERVLDAESSRLSDGGWSALGMKEKLETGRFMIREERFSTTASGAFTSGASNGDSGVDAIADALGTDAAAPPDMRIEEIAGGAKLAEASRSAQGAQSPTLPLPRQLVEVAGHLRHGAVEVQLAPEDLGLVSMKLVASEGGTVLHITADRPETLDLLRRHSGLLYREFRDAGFGGLDLTFGSSKQDRPDGRATEHVLHGIAAHVLPVLETGGEDQRQAPRAMTSCLDIRI